MAMKAQFSFWYKAMKVARSKQVGLFISPARGRPSLGFWPLDGTSVQADRVQSMKLIVDNQTSLIMSLKLNLLKLYGHCLIQLRIYDI